jgi:hypothetical protein
MNSSISAIWNGRDLCLTIRNSSLDAGNRELSTMW